MLDAGVVDAVVVGGGPAGLSAASWLARYRRSTVVVDAAEHRNRFTEKVHGYLGFDPCSPQDLVTRALRDLEAYDGLRFERGTIEDVARLEGDVILLRGPGIEERARSIVFATGVRDEFPDVEGFFEHYGADVFHCPSCDGYEARGKKVAVLGWGEHVGGFARSLLKWASSVAIVTNGMAFEASGPQREKLNERGIDVIEDEALRLLGSRGALSGIALRGGSVLDCQLAFFSIAHHPRVELAQRLGCGLTDEGYLRVDLHGYTGVPGVYGAGDCTPGPQLVQVAAAKGTAAGVAAALALQRDEI